MGDAGSTFLGFILSVLSILACQQLNNPMAISISILFLGVPIFDMIFVIFRRIRIGNSIFIGDKNHLHHRLGRIGLGHYLILFYINSLSVISLLMGIILYLTGTYAIGMTVVAILTIFTLYIGGLSREGKNNERQ